MCACMPVPQMHVCYVARVEVRGSLQKSVFPSTIWIPGVSNLSHQAWKLEPLPINPSWDPKSALHMQLPSLPFSFCAYTHAHTPLFMYVERLVVGILFFFALHLNFFDTGPPTESCAHELVWLAAQWHLIHWFPLLAPTHNWGYRCGTPCVGFKLMLKIQAQCFTLLQPHYPLAHLPSPFHTVLCI